MARADGWRLCASEDGLSSTVPGPIRQQRTTLLSLVPAARASGVMTMPILRQRLRWRPSSRYRHLPSTWNEVAVFPCEKDQWPPRLAPKKDRMLVKSAV